VPARELATAALSKMEFEEDASKDNREDTLDPNQCVELAKVVESQNLLINEYLETSPTLDLTGALGISGLVTQLDSLVRMIKIEGYVNKETRSVRKNDFTRFSGYLEQLGCM
jgi:hypothetical protein